MNLTNALHKIRDGLEYWNVDDHPMTQFNERFVAYVFYNSEHRARNTITVEGRTLEELPRPGRVAFSAAFKGCVALAAVTSPHDEIRTASAAVFGLITAYEGARLWGAMNIGGRRDDVLGPNSRLGPRTARFALNVGLTLATSAGAPLVLIPYAALKLAQALNLIAPLTKKAETSHPELTAVFKRIKIIPSKEKIAMQGLSSYPDLQRATGKFISSAKKEVAAAKKTIEGLVNSTPRHEEPEAAAYREEMLASNIEQLKKILDKVDQLFNVVADIQGNGSEAKLQRILTNTDDVLEKAKDLLATQDHQRSLRLQGPYSSEDTTDAEAPVSEGSASNPQFDRIEPENLH